MLDRKTPPPFQRSTSFDLIKPVNVALSNGLNIHFVSGGEQEVIKVEFIFNAGRWMESAWGVSHFTASLLTKGTERKTSFDIAKIFDQYGAHLEVSPGLDFVTVSLYTLTKNLEPVLVLLFEVLTMPIFPEKELHQSKDIYLQNLRVNQEKTGFMASKLIRKNIFGDQHPYGKELEEVDIAKLERKQLSTFYQRFFGDFQVIVSGKIDAKSQHLIAQTLNLLKINTGDDNINIPSVPGPIKQYLEKENSVQTSVRLGKKSLSRSHAHYTDVLFLNHILGGYFGSRLMRNIREEKGLTYGIYSSLNSMKHGSYMSIGADVNNENRDLAFREIRNELKRLRTELIGQEELDTARYHFIGGLQTEITTPFAHADKIKNILLYGLDQEHYKKMIARVDLINAQELLETAEKYFNEESYQEVAVG